MEQTKSLAGEVLTTGRCYYWGHTGKVRQTPSSSSYDTVYYTTMYLENYTFQYISIFHCLFYPCWAFSCRNMSGWIWWIMCWVVANQINFLILLDSFLRSLIRSFHIDNYKVRFDLPEKSEWSSIWKVRFTGNWAIVSDVWSSDTQSIESILT